MKELFHKNFHIIEKLPAGIEKRKRIYILDTWKPDRDIWLVGCAIGLLCCKSDNYELYLAVSKTPELEPQEFFVGLKKEWLFYQQRDVYTSSTGINDLVSYHFLPEGHGFLIGKGEPLYIKVGAINFMKEDLEYDAFCNLYYAPAE
ncbi:MAG: hypothetical protein A2Z34_02875 [Planctomycetes bacterium RBG_16_59_8]|nr:MAG: hypothetical protein A2Z34_02875 [Planctomycetes bacterium RBG_16_59_8]